MKFRKELIDCKRVVVKVGSSVITKSCGRIDNRKIRKIVEDISELVDQGIEVVLISSGAVSLGVNFLKKSLPESDLVSVQHSASSIGQPKLINTYSRIFDENQKICSQILLTHNDFRDRKRYKHTKKNIDILLKNGIIPILNENDSISFTEISVGDNDHLAAQTAQMINADLVLIITSTNGLYDKDPSDESAKRIPKIPYDFDFSKICTIGKTNVGRGGMESKLQAISKITQLGITAVVSSKKQENIIMDPLIKDVGTIFSPKKFHDQEERDAWLLSLRKPNCYVEIAKSSVKDVKIKNSVIPTVIVKVHGEFYRGDCIEIRCNGEPIATGVCEYGHCEIKKIMGNKSIEIENILGFKTSSVVVQSNNLIFEKEGIIENAS